MSAPLLTVVIVVPAIMVVIALFFVMWMARTTPASARTAIVAGIVIALWALAVSVLGLRDAFTQPDGRTFPPLGLVLLAAFIGMFVAFRTSASLRSLFTNQQHLIRLNVWRLLGVVFLLLMLDGQVPPLWALPAGLGDVAIGATAFWVASHMTAPSGRRRAILFNLLGLLDLVVAVGLGMMTTAGPQHVFDTAPTTELITHFPMVLVPGFLVPLAFAIHVISLAQLREERVHVAH